MTDHRASELATRERLVPADQERIGAALPHGVISRLFAAGMNIQAVVDRTEPDVAQRLLDVTEELDLGIREIPATVFPPSTPDRSATSPPVG